MKIRTANKRIRRIRSMQLSELKERDSEHNNRNEIKYRFNQKLNQKDEKYSLFINQKFVE